ncbi:glycan-binding surface protein [Saccharicrinis fermentans]|nr:glycan-binding surface protein [Saccharicrinis fermentans]
MKKLKILLLLSLFGFLSLSTFFASCSDDEDKGADEVTLYSYGPMPIARGAELRFIGDNLDKVSSIVLPPDLQVISTEFTEHTEKSIKLTVPQDAVEGYVNLLAGEVTVTTKTKIGFSEPIDIDGSFTPKIIKPGGVLTIEGDYLNLVGEVIFTDRIAVDSADFMTISRKQITLMVPPQAQTGKIAVSNGADDPIVIYSEDELTVTVPTLTELSPNPIVAGADLRIKGTDLDLVTSIGLGGDVQVTDFTLEEDGTAIGLTVPMNTQDGNVSLNLASRIIVTSAEELVMVVPTVSVTPTTIKNGAVLTVTGEDLGLISEVVFAGGANGTIQEGRTATEMKVIVPDAAISGEVIFNTTAAKTVSGGDLVLMEPSIVNMAPISAKPNVDVVITGMDLDLVSKIRFAGNMEGAIVSQSETEIVVTIPVGSVTGVITLITVNGTEIISSASLEVLQNLPTFTSYGEAKGVPGEILTINGMNLSLVKKIIFPGGIAATAYGEKSDSRIEVYVPEEVPVGVGRLTMLTYEGEEGFFPEIFLGSTEPVVDPDYVFFDFNGSEKGSWWGNAMGSDVSSDAPMADGTPYWSINGYSTPDYGWDGGFFWRNGGNNIKTEGLLVDRDVLKFDINIHEPVLDGELRLNIRGDDYDANAIYKPWEEDPSFVTVGWITATIPLTEFGITDAQLQGLTKDFGAVFISGSAVKVHMDIDNVRFEKR